MPDRRFRPCRKGSQPLRLRASKVHARKRACIYLAFIFPAVYLTSFAQDKQKEEKKLCANISPYSASLHSRPPSFFAPRHFRTLLASPAPPAITSSKPYPFPATKAGTTSTSTATRDACTSPTPRTP